MPLAGDFVGRVRPADSIAKKQLVKSIILSFPRTAWEREKVQTSKAVRLTKSPGAILNNEVGSKGEGHACMDAGGRATQEQLPRRP